MTCDVWHVTCDARCRYANRARNIRNRAVINRDPYNAVLQQLKQQLAAVTTELAAYKAGATPAAAAAAAAAASQAGGLHHTMSHNSSHSHSDGAAAKEVDQDSVREMRELRGRVTVLMASKQELLQRLGTSERTLQLKLQVARDCLTRVRVCGCVMRVQELCVMAQQRDMAMFKCCPLLKL